MTTKTKTTKTNNGASVNGKAHSNGAPVNRLQKTKTGKGAQTTSAPVNALASLPNSRAALAAFARCGVSGRQKDSATFKPAKDLEGLVAIPTVVVAIPESALLSTTGIAATCSALGSKPVGSMGLRDAQVTVNGGWVHKRSGVTGADMGAALTILTDEGQLPK